MCANPRHLPDGIEVACHKCWQCRENRINDWVGRCIAESKTARATHSITLTYGRDDAGIEDHLRAALLTYSDVQKYLKRLRKDGYPCRYFVAGEYGSEKGRAHWHLIIFWQDRVPEHELNRRFLQKHWTHGWSHWELPSYASIRYVMKYISKDIGVAERQGHVSLSKKPPLGAEYFDRLAGDYVAQGLAPQDLYYWFPEAIDRRTGKPRLFYLSKGSASADLFVSAYLRRFAEAGGCYLSTPWSDLIEDYRNRHTPENVDLRFEGFRGKVPVPHKPPPGGSAPTFSERHNCYFSDTAYGRQWYFRNHEGDLIWHTKIGANESVDNNLSRLADPSRRYREQSRGA
ncbi:MAG: hypothetical protein EOQ55_00480 [Mesorhizobium sp.]|uniref:rolling circle replication-associated protein n=1 Tax=Mesorhizobium sp. TaxID=1871066 RepID=UPI000FEA3E52|nr:hypothetical protein [Mesorhizobium sp.]RWG23267.1 MAG: hypothetical protein EOQ55_00480 [Mesorhizobium sp.]